MDQKGKNGVKQWGHCCWGKGGKGKKGRPKGKIRYSHKSIRGKMGNTTEKIHVKGEKQKYGNIFEK